MLLDTGFLKWTDISLLYTKWIHFNLTSECTRKKGIYTNWTQNCLPDFLSEILNWNFQDQQFWTINQMYINSSSLLITRAYLYIPYCKEYKIVLTIQGSLRNWCKKLLTILAESLQFFSPIQSKNRGGIFRKIFFALFCRSVQNSDYYSRVFSLACQMFRLLMKTWKMYAWVAVLEFQLLLRTIYLHFSCFHVNINIYLLQLMLTTIANSKFLQRIFCSFTFWIYLPGKSFKIHQKLPWI